MRARRWEADRRDDFLAAGYLERDVFPHMAVLLPKAGPDGVELAARAGLSVRRDDHWELVLYALPEARDGIPDGIWFDDEIIWHRQQFGLPGQVASASLFVRGSDLYTAAHQSDVVQRISRRRLLKTRVEKRFHGWDRMLLNAILAVAAEKGLRAVHVPTAEAAMSWTDRNRSVQPELFDRVYDRHPRTHHRVEADGKWWRIDVPASGGSVVTAPVVDEPVESGPIVCICHDIERGRGSVEDEPEFASAIEHPAVEHLQAMLDVEERCGVPATYNVLGELWGDVEPAVRRRGHALGFHSFDHRVSPRGRAYHAVRRRLPGPPPARRPGYWQLGSCRALDGQVRGYRPPQSRLLPDTEEGRLAHFSFEWLASSRRSFGFDTPRQEHGIAKLPIERDDYSLHRDQAYDEWRAGVLDAAARACSGAGGSSYVLSLHDCYADRWLAEYPELLRALAGVGSFRTLDDLADLTIRAAAF